MIPGLIEFAGKHYSMRDCANLTEGRASVGQLTAVMSKFLSNPEKFNCPLPCERNQYNYNFVHTHESSESTDQVNEIEDNNIYDLYFYYSTFQVEQHVETLIYDVGGFLAAAGGNLGLCLGFSCLSVMFAFTQWTRIAYEWLKNNFII